MMLAIAVVTPLLISCNRFKQSLGDLFSHVRIRL
jgi:hypothetical protein